ncbi:MAG: hypothetical protein WCJ72_19895, partial [Chryseobacterium sp.]
PDHMKIRCISCEKTKFLHKKRFEVELKAFQFLGQKWQCQECRNIDLRSVCRSIRAGVSQKIILINGFPK